METIEDRVRRAMMDLLDVEWSTVTLSDTFDDLGADSLVRVEMLLAVEQEFGVDIDDDDLARIDTIGDVVALVERLTAAVDAPSGA